MTAAVCIPLMFVMGPESSTWSPRGDTNRVPKFELASGLCKKGLLPPSRSHELAWTRAQGSSWPVSRTNHAGIAGTAEQSPAAQNGWGDGGTRTANKLCQVFWRPVVKELSHSLNPPTFGLRLLPLTWLPLTRWVHFCECPAMEPRLASICQSLRVESRGTHASMPDPDWPSLRSDKLGACRTSA